MADVAEMFQVLKGLWGSDEELGHFKLTKDLVQGISEAIMYKGFSPKIIIKQLLTKYREAITQKDFIKIGTQTHQLEFLQEMSILCLIFGTRGSKLTKMMSKSSPDGIEFITRMAARYGITESKKGMDNTTITLPRVAACFPMLTLYLLHDKKMPPLIEFQELHLTETDSRSLCSPLMISMCGEFGEGGIFWLCFYCHVLTDKKLNPSKLNTDISTIFNYYIAAYKTEAMTRAGKLAFMTKMGFVYEETWGLPGSVQTADEMCKQELKETFLDKKYEKIWDKLDELANLKNSTA